MTRQVAALAGLATAVVVAIATLPQAVGLFGQVYRIDGGGVLAAPVSTPTPQTAVQASPAPLYPTVLPPVIPSTSPTISASATVPITTPTSPPAPPPPTTATVSSTPTPTTIPTATVAATITPTARTAATATRSAIASPTAVLTLTPSPSPSATPDPCLGRDAVLRFVPAELTLTSTGSGRGRLQLENTGQTGRARDIELQLSLISGADRLKSLTINGLGQLFATTTPVITVGELQPGASFDIDIAYEAVFQQLVDAAVLERAALVIELQLTVVKEACAPAINASGKVTARVLLAPAQSPVVTAVPVDTKPVATQRTDVAP